MKSRGRLLPGLRSRGLPRPRARSKAAESVKETRSTHAKASCVHGRQCSTYIRSPRMGAQLRRVRNYGLLCSLFLPLFLSIVTNVMANEACPTGTTCTMTGYAVNMCYAATGCSCNAHTYGPLGGPCQACPANSGKPEYYSSGCDCNTGYQGPKNGPCIPCPENSYSAFDYSLGDNYGGKRCLCNTGYSKIEMATNPNWARSCNTNPCSVTASSYTYQEYGGLYADYIPANAVNGVTDDGWDYNEGTVNPRRDLKSARSCPRRRQSHSAPRCPPPSSPIPPSSPCAGRFRLRPVCSRRCLAPVAMDF